MSGAGSTTTGDAGHGDAVIDLQVLGPLRVVLDGRAVELGPARRRTLLAALCAQPGQVLSVDVLADRIWDGRPPANPVATVHAYVSRLRGSLRAFAPGGAELPSPLRTHAPGYRLDVAPDAIDEHRFAASVARARDLREAGRIDEARRVVRAGLALWRGEAYVDISAGFARREADRLAGARLAAQELAVQVDLDLGRHDTVLPEIEALLDTEPLREGLHAALMLALYRSGRQAEALRHFVRVREEMADELGVDPGPDLRRVHDQILRQDPVLDLLPPRERADPVDAAPDPVTDDVGTGPRLIGRDGELATVGRLLERAENARPGVVALVGEAGIGKTRLAEEVAVIASRRGARVAWGRCWQHEGAPALWPWVQVLDTLLEHATPDERTAVADGRGRPALALLPEPSGAPGPHADRSSRPAELTQVRLYDAVTHVLEVLTRAHPALVVLEDMHWSDRASRELTEYVVAHLDAARLAIVVTVRSPSDDASRAGTELLAALSRSGRAERVVLGGLTSDSVAAYVADRTGGVLDLRTSEALTDRTGGNPFFVAELVRLLVTDAAQAEGAGAGLPGAVPDSIRDVITRRLQRLPETDQAVLGVAAVLGRTFDLELIESASGLDADAVDEAVDRATGLGIVCSDPAVPGRHRFVHALTQQTLLDTTGPARIRRLHSRVAEAIAARQGEVADISPTTAETLAYHWASAGSQAEVARAIDVSLEVADEAVRYGRYPQAESLLLRALDLTVRLDGAAGGTREMTARLRLWSMYTATYGPGAPGAAAQHHRATQLVQRYGGARDLLAAHQAAYARAIFLDDLAAVDALVGEMASAATASGDDLLRAAAHLAQAQVLTHRGRPREALVECRAVEQLDDPLDDVPVGIFPITPACSLRLWQALAGSVVGDEEGVTRALALLEERTRRAGPTTVAYVTVNLAFVHALRDEPGQALRHASQGREDLVRHGFVEALGFVDVLLAWARERERPGAHLVELDTALAATRPMATMALRPSLLTLVADVRLRAGRYAEARAAVAVGLAESALTGDELSLAELHRLDALALAASGADAADVSAALDRADRIARAQGAQLFLHRLRASP